MSNLRLERSRKLCRRKNEMVLVFCVPEPCSMTVCITWKSMKETTPSRSTTPRLNFSPLSEIQSVRGRSVLHRRGLERRLSPEARLQILVLQLLLSEIQSFPRHDAVVAASLVLVCRGSSDQVPDIWLVIMDSWRETGARQFRDLKGDRAYSSDVDPSHADAVSFVVECRKETLLVPVHCSCQKPTPHR